MLNAKPYLYFGLFFLFWILLISQMWRFPYFLLSILGIISLSYFVFFKEKKDLLIFLIAGMIGPIGEGLVAHSGLWTYHGETILGIPYWLPLAWGITAVSVYKLISAITK